MARVSAIGSEYVVLVLTRNEANGLFHAADSGLGETPADREAAVSDPKERAGALRAIGSLARGLWLVESDAPDAELRSA